MSGKQDMEPGKGKPEVWRAQILRSEKKNYVNERNIEIYREDSAVFKKTKVRAEKYKMQTKGRV